MNRKLKVSILIPVFKGSKYLQDALHSIYYQDFNFDEIIIVDDNQISDIQEIKKTQMIIAQFADQRIKYIKNNKNLGSQQTIKKLASLASGDILFYLCQDDILAKNAIQRTYDAFLLDDSIGVVTRPYFWFNDDSLKPLRAIYPPDSQKDRILSIFDEEQAIKAIFDSVGQLSGLAFKKKLITIPFHTDVFPGHIYPFAGILKRYKCVFLKDFTVAVRIQSSQSRNISSIYNTSPLESWVKMFNTVYGEKKYERVRRLGIKHIATHYVGLLQIKNFGIGRAVKKEIINIIKFHWQSIFDLKFWSYTIIILLTPRKILLKLSDAYKKYVLSRLIRKIDVRQFVQK